MKRRSHPLGLSLRSPVRARAPGMCRDGPGVCRSVLSLCLSVCLSACLSACAPAARPVLSAAAVTPPAQWQEQAGPQRTMAPDWWRGFGDPALDDYVRRALANNTDILTAASRVEQARANVAVARAALFPGVSADLGASRGRSLGDFGVSTANSIQPELTLSWQTDLFGRLRDQQRAARNQFAATEADRDGMRLSVASQVAQAYFTLVALDTKLIVTRETIQTRLASLKLAQDQTALGYTSQYELTQAQSEYESVLGQEPELLRGVRNAGNALTLLCGEAPAATLARGPLLKLQTPDVPAALPSTLLRRRPDLVAAEYRIAAADASLADQRAAFLPSVSLSASFGQLFVDALRYNPVTVWTLGGSVLAPIFNAGNLRANVDIATAERDQAAFSYRNTALTAFRDVENALTDVRRYGEQIEIVKRRRATLIRSLALATDRYRGGYATYLDQLDAQRNLYSTELEAIGIRQSQLQAIVQLYVAFGGGWNDATSQPATGGGSAAGAASAT
ncbi:MAG: efflux transporter outer membrane subunit [Janthinobacterium lividum]